MKRNTLLILSLLCSVFFIYSCSKELSFEKSSSTGSAEGSLWDTLNNCLPDSVHGTFYNGVQPGGDTAFVEIHINVTATGSYNISTDLQNGFMFIDSGYFATTGINTVQLKPIGTPLTIQPTVFSISFDSTTCFFTVNVNDSTGTGLGGGTDTTTPPPPVDSTNLSDTAWQFSVGTDAFHGHIELAYEADSLGQKYLAIVGTTASGDTTFGVGMFMPGAIAPGTYSTATEAVFAFADNVAASNIYEATPLTASSGVVTITIISYDSVTGIVTGTFTGTAVDSLGNPVTITDGSFRAKVT